MRPFFLLLLLLPLSPFLSQPLIAQSTSKGYATADLSSHHLLPGESATLTISLHGAQATSRPTFTEVPGVAINFARSITRLDSTRSLSLSFVYRVTPVKASSYTIPPFTVRSAKGEHRTEPVTLQVHQPSSLTKITTPIKDHILYAGIFSEKTTLYQGEQTPLIVKLYSQDRFPIADWGLPDPKRDNVLAWRFTLPRVSGFNRVNIDGSSYIGATYHTTVSGIQPGAAQFGPSSLRLIVQQTIFDPKLGGNRRALRSVDVNIPPVKLNILPLPAGAPEGFDGAVGQFQIDAHCRKTDFKATDTTEVILRIGGTGNLENLQAPVLDDPRWEVIDTSKVTRGEERKNISGIVTFRQLIRASNPAQPPAEIPAYTFSFFNPEDKQYHSVKSQPIPVTISAAQTATTTPPPNNSDNTITSPDQMQGIQPFIGRIASSSPTLTEKKSLPWIHIIGALTCLLLIITPLIKKAKLARQPTPSDQKKSAALKKLTETKNSREFYRAAGRFIERAVPATSYNEQTAELLEERDAKCFLAEDTPTEDIPKERRKEVATLLAKLSRTTLIIAACFAIFTHHATAAEPLVDAHSAWQGGNYQQAIDLYQQAYPNIADAPADVLYNLGNCHHRIGQQGKAALRWRQTLAADATHPDARLNLIFTQQQAGAQAPKHQAWQVILARSSLANYWRTLWVTVWGFALSITLLIFHRRKFLVPSIIGCVVFPVLATLTWIAINFYPDDHLFAPIDQQVIILEKTHIYTEAHREQADAPELPATSLVRAIAHRGNWIHIRTNGETEGWIPAKHADYVIPRDH